ncbi:MAG: manganese efflux pump [Methanospirillaceae archaeon]|nr:manganese efflux pump [Methanospirillaceae archaeon]
MESLYTSLLIALGLAMDCLAVSFAAGTTTNSSRLRTAATLAIFFGGFQCGMTVAGWALGTGFADLIAAWDHWAAAGLLWIIGIKMIFEGIRNNGREDPPDVIHLIPVLVLAIATSIDALAVGIGFAFLQVDPLIPAAVIGIVAALVSAAGVCFGGKAGHLLGRKVDIFGGMILVLIGGKIFLEHTIWI